MAEKPTSAPSSVPDRLTVIVSRAEQQTNNPRFSDEFREELKQMKLTEQELTELASRFEQSKVLDSIKNDARTVILERVKEDRQTLMKTLNPLTWTPENKRAAVLTVGGIAVGGVVLSLIGSAMRRTREAAEKTAETVQYTGRVVRNAFMYALGGTVLAVAGFAGIKVWQNWGKVEQMLASARMLNEKMLKAGGEQLTAMQKQLAETQKQIAVMTGLAEEKVAAMTATAKKAKEQIQETVTPEKVEEATEKGAEVVAQKFLGKGLTLLHPDLTEQAGFDIRNREDDSTKINGTLTLGPVRALKIADLVRVAAFENFEGARTDIEKLLNEAGQKTPLGEPQLRSVYFLALVANAQQNNIRQPEGKNKEDLDIASLLDQTGSVSRLLVATEEKMQDVDITSPSDIARRLMEIYKGEGSLLDELNASEEVQKHLEKFGLKKEDLPAFALFCTNNGSAALAFSESISHNSDQQKYIDALVKLRGELMEQGALKADVQQYIKLYAHGQDDFLKVLDERMKSINVSDALQLYIYLQKAKSEKGEIPADLNNSNPLVALMMQIKVMSMIASQDRYTGEKLKAFLTIMAGEQGSAWMLGTSEINLPESLKKTLPLLGNIVRNVAKRKAEDLSTTVAASTEALNQETSPWLKWTVGSLGTGIVGMKIRNMFQNWRGNVLTRQIVHEQHGWGYAAHNNPDIFQRIRKSFDFTYQKKINQNMYETREMLRALHDSKGRDLTAEEVRKAIMDFEDKLSSTAARAQSLDNLPVNQQSLPPTRTTPATRADAGDAADDITRSASSIDGTPDIRPSSGAADTLPNTTTRPADLGSAPQPDAVPARSAPLPDTDIPDIPDDATIPFQRTPPVLDDAARAGDATEEITRTASGTTETITPRMPSAQDTLPLRTPAQDLPPADLGGPAPRLNPSPAASAVPGPTFNVVREDESVVDAQGRPVDATPGSTEVARGAEATEQLADEARWAKIVSKYPGTVSLGDVDAFLRLAQEERLIMLDKDTLALIGESSGAKKIIAGAIESTDIAEITRAMQAAKMARNLRVGLNGVGAAGDLFGAYMAWADFQANGERIESARQTKNQALAELYANANYMYAAEGTQSATGLVIGGVAIVRAYSGGQSVLTALGASGGLILLPVAAAAVGGGLMYRQAESVSADWTRNAKDWQRTLTPGEMLEKLKATGPGTRSYWQGWGKGTITEMGLRKTFTSREAFEAWEAKGEGTIEDANAQMRYELTKGYLASSTMLAPRPQETEAQYRQRFDQFVIDRLEYTTLVTEGMYGYMPSGYQMSNAYAELMAKSRELQKTGGSEKLTWTDPEGKEQSIDIKDFADLPWSAKPGEMGRQFVLGKYFYQNKVNTIMQFNIMEKLPTGLNAEQKKRAIEQQIILETTDDLMKLDGRIASADFAGLELTGGDQQSKALARYTASRMYLEELDTQAQTLLTQAKTDEGITPETYDNALERIRGIIGSNDPLEYQRIGYERKYIEDGYVLDVAQTQALLMPGTMFKALDKDLKDVKVRKTITEAIAKTPVESLRKMRKELGELTLIKTEGMVQNGNVFSVQYGNIFNKYLYAKYNGDQWQVSIGGSGAGPWQKPEELKAAAGGTFGFSADTAGRYNNIIRSLAEANAEFQK